MADRRKLCGFAKFDDIWGEYKCVRKARRLYNPSDCAGCKEYKKKRGVKNTEEES